MALSLIKPTLFNLTAPTEETLKKISILTSQALSTPIESTDQSSIVITINKIDQMNQVV